MDSVNLITYIAKEKFVKNAYRSDDTSEAVVSAIAELETRGYKFDIQVVVKSIAYMKTYASSSQYIADLLAYND